MWSDREDAISSLKARLSASRGEEFRCASTIRQFLTGSHDGGCYIKKLNHGPAEFVSIDRIKALKKRRVDSEKEGVQASPISASLTPKPGVDESDPVFETLLVTQFQSLLEGHTKTEAFLDTFNELIRLPQSSVDQLCQKVPFKTLPDETLAEIMSSIIDCESISFHNLVIFYRASLLQKVAMLDVAPSRILLSTIFSAAKANPKAVVQGLLSPLLTKSAPGKFQADIINRTIKESLDKPSLVYFLQALTRQPTEERNGEMGVDTIQWNDYTISVMHSLLVSKAPFKRNLLLDLLKIMEENFSDFKSSSKYATLILLIVKNFPADIKEDVDFVTRVVENSTTFVKKSVLTSLKKLR
ncbi:hypothetical protein K493DRAFT_336767 [Basidiobolus meristosporus CBS 931.73]|uniref:Fanconi Anaemia group E protein C-terminal domain-containing protein n=1 Tax=Basidiobolus meristosporus CBS 931.73 TaxID=1314790 RepID=A0A1Y1YFR9_9FUNG|nr:hypothetical protein K493DRAFT_336767 [Basidiobolus meristosporus CBS 931.73]|eukprot:ORX96829.1 hypothetical protein K493DRAFT_336767 [Basidiobolus meristosporus CBS 931.73]